MATLELYSRQEAQKLARWCIQNHELSGVMLTFKDLHFLQEVEEGKTAANLSPDQSDWLRRIYNMIRVALGEKPVRRAVTIENYESEYVSPIRHQRSSDARDKYSDQVSRKLRLTELALRDPQLKPLDAELLSMILYKYQEKDGGAIMSLLDITDEVKAHRSAVARSLNRIDSRGYIDRLRSNGGRNKRTKYVPRFDLISHIERLIRADETEVKPQLQQRRLKRSN